MDPVALAIGLSWILGAALITGATIPLLQGRVKRNHLYGVRFPESFQSDEAWFAINRYGAKRMIVWSAPMAALGVVVLFLPLKLHPGASLFLGFAPLIFVLTPHVETWRFARRHWPKA